MSFIKALDNFSTADFYEKKSSRKMSSISKSSREYYEVQSVISRSASWKGKHTLCTIFNINWHGISIYLNTLLKGYYLLFII